MLLVLLLQLLLLLLLLLTVPGLLGEDLFSLQNTGVNRPSDMGTSPSSRGGDASGDVHLEVAVLQVARPEGLLAVVERQHGLHAVDEHLQALLQGRHVIGQARVLTNLGTTNEASCCRRYSGIS